MTMTACLEKPKDLSGKFAIFKYGYPIGIIESLLWNPCKYLLKIDNMKYEFYFIFQINKKVERLMGKEY